ncbi:MAG: acyl-CoA thioesterase [Clostridiales bacterium]|nr:acyl-CoA thioesterase [Clostridiales bacterium]
MSLKPYFRKVHYYETDQMGIVHHSNYIRWFEEARADFMEQLAFPYTKVIAAGVDFPLLGASCEYKSMARFGESVLIFSSFPELTETRITVGYRILDAASGDLRAAGQTRHCYYDNGRKRPVSLKKVLPELYELFYAEHHEEQAGMKS